MGDGAGVWPTKSRLRISVTAEAAPTRATMALTTRRTFIEAAKLEWMAATSEPRSDAGVPAMSDDVVPSCSAVVDARPGTG